MIHQKKKTKWRKLNKVAVIAAILLLGLWNHHRFKVLTPSQASSSSSTDERKTRPTAKVVILNRLDVKKGGPEALHQILIASHKLYPKHTFMGPRFVKETEPEKVKPDRYFYTEYPNTIETIPYLHSLDNLTRGGVLVVPEIEPCPMDSVQGRGVRVFTYMVYHIQSTPLAKCICLSPFFTTLDKA